MINTNKVRRILRAKNGSQIPKFQNGGPNEYIPLNIPITNASAVWDLNSIINPTTVGSQIATEKFTHTNGVSINIPDITNNLNSASLKISPKLQQFTQDYKDKVIKKAKWQNLKNNVGNFVSNNASLIGAGLDYFGNQFNDTINSQGYDTAMGALDTVGNIVMPRDPKVGFWLKMGKTATNTLNDKFGKNFNYTVDKNLISRAGSSWSGYSAAANRLASESGRIGMFNFGKHGELEDRKSTMKTQGAILSDLLDTNDDLLALAGNDLNYLRYNMDTNGGYDQRYIRGGKNGMKLSDKISLIKSRKYVNHYIDLNSRQIEEFAKGGTLDWEPNIEIPEFQEGGSIKENWEPTIEILDDQSEIKSGEKTRTLEELIEYAKQQNPRFIQRLSEEPRGIKFIDNEGNEAEGSHYLESMGEYVVPRIQEINGELKFLNEQDAINRAVESGNYLKMLPEEAIIFAKNYKQGWPRFFFKEVYDYYKDYDLSGATLIRDNQARVEGNKIHVNTDEDAVHELWHFLSQNKPNEKYKEFYDNLNDNRIIELGGDLNFVKRFEGDPGHFYHPSELEARIKAAKFKSQGQNYTRDFFKDLRSDESKYGYNMRDLLYMFNDENLEKIFNLKKGGTIGEELETPEIEETTQKNIIPEGALHKNKHHIEHTEGITKKGIPVVDNEGNQQAEVEKEEIIFNLEVTKKLEELYKDYYDSDKSQKEKDEAAIEAGKLLVYQILFNTDDRTGLIKRCEEGGKL